MKRLKKKSKLIVGSIILLVAIIGLWAGYRAYEEREELRVEREAELEIIYTYLRLHYAFALVAHPDTMEIDDDGYSPPRRAGSTSINIYERWGRYRENNPDRINDHGIEGVLYLLLRFYYHRAGVYLSYEMVENYFSEEFEPDGSLRLYNNGNHPEIEAFVVWKWDGRRKEEFDDYVRRITGIQSTYFREHQDHGFEIQVVDDLSPQMLDALARAEADPDYELDLTSLQEAGY